MIFDYDNPLRLGKTSCVYLAGVIQYIIKDILKIAAEEVIGDKDKITLEDITAIINGDNIVKQTLNCL
jgi:hypothetical protein